MMFKNETCAKAIESLTTVPVFVVEWLKCIPMEGGGEILFDQLDEREQLAQLCIFNRQNGDCQQRLANLSFSAPCWISSYADNSCDLFDRAAPSSTLDLPFVVRRASDVATKYIVAALLAAILIMIVCVVSLVRRYLALRAHKGPRDTTTSEFFDDANENNNEMLDNDDIPQVFTSNK
jgi:hypothetical protein